MEHGIVLYPHYSNLIIIGYGGHGRVIRDIAVSTGHYNNIFFFDDNIAKLQELKQEFSGTSSDARFYVNRADFIIAIGDNQTRRRIQKMLEYVGGSLVTLIHPFTSTGSNVSFGRGTVVMPGAVVNNGSQIGDGVILNTGCSVDHDSTVGAFSHISVGAHLAGTVAIGEECFIGAGSTVINNVSICNDVVVGAGGTVIEDIREAGTYAGVPARLLHH